MSGDTFHNPAPLEPSALGTKDYWRKLYASELSSASTSTPWFAESCAEQRTAAYLATRLDRHERARASVLDLGTGNGNMLRRLRRRGWQGPLVGADYCAESVELARSLAEDGRMVDSEDEEESEDEGAQTSDQGEHLHADEDLLANGGEVKNQPIAFYEHDVLHDSEPPWPPGLAPRGFDVVLDKGTFDAISLSDEVDPETGQRAFMGYAARAEALVRPGGLLLVTSCNWTEQELIAWYTEPQTQLKVLGCVTYPKFKFGGQEGSAVVGVCFQRKVLS